MIVARWAHGPITRAQHDRWHRQPRTLWFWTVLEVDLHLEDRKELEPESFLS